MMSYRKQKELIRSIEYDMKFIDQLMYNLWLNRNKVDEINLSIIDILSDIMEQILKAQDLVYEIHKKLRENAIWINDMTDSIY